MKHPWECDRDLAAKLSPIAKRILGEHLIADAPLVEDQQRNTDFIIHEARIAYRFRGARMIKYRHEFTIRADRPSGQATELAKAMQGWGDYLFYGFANQSVTDFQAWLIGDLEVFRRTLKSRDWRNGRCPLGEFKRNNGGYEHAPSGFLVFRLADFPPNFIVAQSNPATGANGLDHSSAAREGESNWKTLFREAREIAKKGDYPEILF